MVWIYQNRGDAMLSVARRMLLCGLLLLPQSGCSERPGIQQYTTAKPAPPLESARAAVPMAWFFKLQGPVDRVADLRPTFEAFVKSVQFSDSGQPSWTLPSGWQELDAQVQGRQATIRIGDAPGLLVTVTSLPTEDPYSPSYLKANFDRWRGQLALENSPDDDTWLTAAHERDEFTAIREGGRILVLVNLVGHDKDGEPTRMLAAMAPFIPPEG